MCVFQDPTVASPTKCYLDYLTLPNNETSKVDLRKASTVLLSHLDRLAAPYIILENVRDVIEPHTHTYMYMFVVCVCGGEALLQCYGS